MLKITKYLTPINYTKMSNKKNEYLVIHYVGAVSSAKNNSIYYHTERSASASYFVDDTSIYQVVEDMNKAWHCGGGLQGTGGHKYFQICTNSNSIGIEMCLDKVNHISDKTISNTADLVQFLMKKYNIPASKVIRHYDVTGKICPAMYIDETKWSNVKKILVGDVVVPVTKPTVITKVVDTVKNVVSSKKKTGYVKILINNLSIRNKASWDETAISGTVKINEVFTVAKKVKVGTAYMYLLKSGVYITASDKYVEYFEK